MAAASETPRPAEVVYTHVGVTTGDVFRVEDECFIDPALTAPWGWSVQVTNNLADVQAEGERFKLAIRWLNGKKLLPLRAALKQLKGGSAWRTGSDTLDVWGVVTSLDSLDGKIVVQSTLALKPKVFFLKDPTRIVIDLVGGRMDETTRMAVGPGGRAGQWKADIVRVVQETDLKLGAPSYSPVSTRAFTYAINGPQGVSEGHVQPQEEAPIEQEVKDPPPDIKIPPAGVTKTIKIGKPEILSEAGNRTELKIGLSANPPHPPKFGKAGPTTLEITLPGVKSENAETYEFKGRSVEGVEVLENNGAVMIRIKTARPMGVEFSTAANELRVNFIRPDVGDGRLAGKIIVVDAGHGGHDKGAPSPAGEVHEKTLTLSIAKKVAENLTSQGATVIMTRKTDVFIPLKERSEIANRNGADLFVSVHINSTRKPNGTSGGITFYHKRDAIGQVLADCVQREIAKVSQLPNLGTWSDLRVAKTSGFAVLRYSRMPAILLEMGFINHSKDRARMKTTDFQDSVAKAIVKGIRIYLGDVKAEEIESK